ncbi:MAG: hypothetical protein KDB88_08880, partial [Flavobacteriales bacterium]|nr:hypothetical protein [Flavobacteriales bacterium]
FTDKSDPAILKRELGLSKKAFKKALGALYKARKIRMDDRGITWIGPGPVEN